MKMKEPPMIEKTVEEITALMKYAQLPSEELLTLLGKYVREERAKNTDKDILLVKLFYYGYVCGQRTERKRRSEAPKKSDV